MVTSQKKSEKAESKPAAGRRERRAAETRVRLFRCAMQLFAERGFQNVTVEEITEAADVGKGTFFNYFQTKDHVLGVLAEIQIAKVKEALTQAEDGKQAVRAILHRLAMRLIEEPGQSPSLARATIGSFLASEEVRNLVRRFMDEGCRMMEQIVVLGQQRGEIDGAVQKKKAARQLQQSLMGTVLLWSLHGEPPLALHVEDTFEQFWRAIAASARGQER